jgi:hypothetical protein
VRIEQGLEASDEPYFKIDVEASTAALDSLRSSFVTIEAMAMARAGSELVAFFGDHGRVLADGYGLEYPNELDRLLRGRLEALT